MNRVFKIFLLWLLIAALPLQGMAAVVKASCGPRHHDMRSIMTMNGAHHRDAGAAHHHVDEENDADASRETHADTAGSPAHAGTAEKSSYHSSYCSFCAACSVGAAAPPPFLSPMSSFLQMEAASAPAALSFTGFIPPSPERPTRHFPA